MAEHRSPSVRTPGPAKTPSGSTQRSITSFFSKPASSSSAKPKPPPSASTTTTTAATPTPAPRSGPRARGLKDSTTTFNSKTNARAMNRRSSTLTPVPSSDVLEPPSSSQENMDLDGVNVKVENGHDMPPPLTPAELPPRQTAAAAAGLGAASALPSSPSRKTKKAINYAESSDDDEDPFEALESSRNRRRGRSRIIVPDDEDDDVYDAAAEPVDEDEDVAEFVVSDESDDEASSRKRKRPAKKTAAPRKRVASSALDVPTPVRMVDDLEGQDGDDEELPPPSTAQQWRFDPNAPPSLTTRALRPPPLRTTSSSSTGKQKAHTSEPQERYPWLANITDINRNPPGHPDYDPGTIYVPPAQWNKFSPFEKQYWAIKQKLWDTVVFFKKGKFYELYENDATIGHQLFDLKMTDRVNMRMVGVPESSLDIWVNQFIAKGYKVARVDQMESALGKEMRERGGDDAAKNKKADKVIRRELACILTAGTLVDGSMLQDDLATYCAAIKESVIGGVPHIGIAFVDCATGQFYLTQFDDDVELTKFETFVAQTCPRELLLEKSHISTKALRILKSNTSPTTIWNYLRPGLEFWDADTTRRELVSGGYFAAAVEGEEGEGEGEKWPKALIAAKNKDLVMSALGALVQYLRNLKIEHSLLSQGNFDQYSPIRRNGTLILDGQTLINLEIFSNSVNGGPEGTLFTLLNRCVTPFGKRLFRQWVCHPLCDIKRIEERLDAVDMLNSDRSVREQFSSQMTKMPDLERLISRIHAGVCKPDDFVRVLEGFEQIEYTMTLLGAWGGGQGLVDRLLASMPDLDGPLTYWKTAFDRSKAKGDKVFVPERGIEDDFDESQDRIEVIKRDLHKLLEKKKAELKCKTLKFTDSGKEIYQLEAPKSLKVPADWRQMSATASVKRYYFRALSDLVRDLQEAEETHSQIIKEVASRFFRRFDADYETWLRAIRIISQLDCLVGLAKASSSLGEPSCRPQFVDQERSVVEFSELRHPCMLNTVTDFIPNDIQLGGDSARINLLTGANAAGKSTILRMSCTAVIMAQIGCHVPASSARLTPVDRIMSRLGANDNIFASQSTFFVELSETKKILSEATPRSLVILDELGRGTSSYDGVAVAQAVLHHVATHIGCVGFFATHYHSLATEFENHPEIRARRMQIHVDDEERKITFLYKLEDGVAEGSFGMHCAAMCGINDRVIARAEVAAREWEHTSRLKESLDKAKSGCYIPLGILSDVAGMLRGDDPGVEAGVDVLLRAIAAL
ncbi:DNA mismatch repair protein msh6 [Sodiomyces alkalinus F11]|uniref:DNA mismatch repair protein n=1 Tax=Sodiomyces alkalinus (strain CBS 110278 / VKM F-3762 / F11) TaxID=1314773 RepID=A0A3N2PP73_SODAK|nr:DNA mismatch repair protein msh6 [Sodiomyces alkalinus F11]ROT36318.1 DNA mismatch repair protein msh6 [Sodiomyces alkalinus F11]